MAASSLSEKLNGVTRFGKLTVVDPVAIPHGKKWKVRCRCDCGVETTPFTFSLTSGSTASCGTPPCNSKNRRSTAAVMGRANRRHGMAGTTEYLAWSAMKKRCHDPRNKAYRNYGARGISVCREWRESFEAFLAHIGPKPSPELSIDRIDNNRGYEPGNVRWADAQTQNRNRRPFMIVPGSRPLPG